MTARQHQLDPATTQLDHDPDCPGGRVARFQTARRVEHVCRGCGARASVPRVDPWLGS